MFYQSEISLQRCWKEQFFFFFSLDILAADFSSISDQTKKKKIPFVLTHFRATLWTLGHHMHNICVVHNLEQEMPDGLSRLNPSRLLDKSLSSLFPPSSNYSIFHLQFLPLHFHFFVSFFFSYIYLVHWHQRWSRNWP